MRDSLVESDIPSPCVHICYQDDDDICQGCYRSATEISAWPRMTNSERQQVLNNIVSRETGISGIDFRSTSDK